MYKTVRACVGSGCSLTPGCRCVEPAQPSPDCFCCFQSNHMKIVAAPRRKIHASCCLDCRWSPGTHMQSSHCLLLELLKQKLLLFSLAGGDVLMQLCQGLHRPTASLYNNYFVPLSFIRGCCVASHLRFSLWCVSVLNCVFVLKWRSHCGPRRTVLCLTCTLECARLTWKFIDSHFKLSIGWNVTIFFLCCNLFLILFSSSLVKCGRKFCF